MAASHLMNFFFLFLYIAKFNMMKSPEASGAKPSKIVFEESDESSSDEEADIQKELAEFTFEELQKARADGSHAIHLKSIQERKHSRANKNRPMEVTCKKPVSRYRETIQVPKKVVRDPRFESLCGTLVEDGFRKRYNFLFEDNLPAEKKELQKQLKKTKDPGITKQLKNRISWIVTDEVWIC
uniref:rRNA biogenesis protein RRP36 n=2 Tax=Kalanchoe fedtschenkoi TaxID=63787 RepID=A0A7N0TRA6_KALFE